MFILCVCIFSAYISLYFLLVSAGIASVFVCLRNGMQIGYVAMNKLLNLEKRL